MLDLKPLRGGSRWCLHLLFIRRKKKNFRKISVFLSHQKFPVLESLEGMKVVCSCTAPLGNAPAMGRRCQGWCRCSEGDVREL